MKHSKRLFSSLFYVPKYEKVSDKSFSRIILSSVLGVLICGICLAGLTWAWYTSSVSSAGNTITAAQFAVTTTVTNSNTEEAVLPGADSTYTLPAGTYTVTATASGTGSTGYCKVNFNGEEYFTVQLFTIPDTDKPQKLTFTVTASENSMLAVSYQWGTYTGTATAEAPFIGNSTDERNHTVNSIGTSTPPSVFAEPITENNAEETTGEAAEEAEETYALTDVEQSYTVQKGDSLSKIANKYGTTIAILSAYNSIENPSSLSVGVIIRIPPASYTIPEADTSTNTAEPTEPETSAEESSEPAQDSPSESTKPDGGTASETTVGEDNPSDTQNGQGAETAEDSTEEQ